MKVVVGVGVGLIGAVAVAAVLAQPESSPAEQTASDPAGPATEDAASGTVEDTVWPVDRLRGPGITLLFDTGERDTVAVDLDTGEQRALELRQHPGERPFRIWRLGPDWVVTGGTVTTIEADLQPASTRGLTAAAFFVPAAEPDQLWLIDDPAGLADEPGGFTARLSGLDGQILASIEVEDHPAGVEVLRGVPGGLALRTGDGELHAYDLDGNLTRNFLGETAVHLLDANAEQVMWCDDACGRLQLTDGIAALEGHVAAEEDGGVGGVNETTSFDPAASWLAPDGRHVLAAARVELEDGSVDRILRVYGQNGSPIVSTSVPLGDVRGAWSPDARQFAFTITTPPGTAGPRTLGHWRAGPGFRTADLRPHLDGLGDFIALDTQALPAEQ